MHNTAVQYCIDNIYTIVQSIQNFNIVYRDHKNKHTVNDCTGYWIASSYAKVIYTGKKVEFPIKTYIRKCTGNF